MELGHHENAGLDTDLARRAATDGLWAEIAELSAEQAPRRFSVCEIDVDADDGAVLAWGFVFPDGAMLCTPDGTPRGVLRSAESTWKLFRRGAERRLIWIDPPVTD
jgi:hypothetical protein